MGLDICVIKPIRRISFSSSSTWDIYSLDYSPIKHLTVVEEGRYECEEFKYPTYRSLYGTFNDLRKEVCQMVFSIPLDKIAENIEQYIGRPFIEFLYFSVCEGSFDYVVAEKLYKDFKGYSEKAKSFLTPVSYEKYLEYMEVLKAAAENKAVVIYL